MCRWTRAPGGAAGGGAGGRRYRVLVTATQLPGAGGSAGLARCGALIVRRTGVAAAGGCAGGGGGAHTPAYVLYTSGSTGTPKGVWQTHGGVLWQVARYAASLQLVADDRLSLLSSYGFDAAVQDVFGALLSGASVHPVDVRDGREAAARWTSWWRGGSRWCTPRRRSTGTCLAVN